ncbi:hypothetical protein ACJX0J_023715, partial [Zea mays]
ICNIQLKLNTAFVYDIPLEVDGVPDVDRSGTIEQFIGGSGIERIHELLFNKLVRSCVFVRMKNLLLPISLNRPNFSLSLMLAYGHDLCYTFDIETCLSCQTGTKIEKPYVKIKSFLKIIGLFISWPSDDESSAVREQYSNTCYYLCFLFVRTTNIRERFLLEIPSYAM